MTRLRHNELGYRERFFSAQDGLELHYRDYGDPLATGAPLLCLGGLARSSKDFHDLALRLYAGRRVVALDYRGRGRSGYDRDWRNYRPEVCLSDTMHLLSAAGLHRVVVCGTSFGGLLAMGLGVVMPTALAGVILNDIGPQWEAAALDRIRGYIGVAEPQPDLDAAAGLLKEIMPSLGLDGHERWRGLAEATYRLGDDGRWHKDWDVRLAKTLDGKTPDLWAYYRSLARRPVLALRGENSDLLSPAVFRQMALVKPDLIQVTVPGVGHVPSLDEPQAEQAIDEFLARIDATQGH